MNDINGKADLSELFINLLCASTLLLLLAIYFTACTTLNPQEKVVSEGPTVKIYISSPVDGGAIRRQERELIPYPQTSGWIMQTMEDFETEISYYTSEIRELRSQIKNCYK